MGTFDRVLTFAVGIAVFAALSAVTLDRYGGASYFPALLATLAAVVVAFEFERHRERQALKRAEESLMQRRKTEARKRLLALRTELEKNQVSIDTIVEALKQVRPGPFVPVHPQLLSMGRGRRAASV